MIYQFSYNFSSYQDVLSSNHRRWFTKQPRYK